MAESKLYISVDVSLRRVGKTIANLEDEAKRKGVSISYTVLQGKFGPRLVVLGRGTDEATEELACWLYGKTFH